MCGSANSESEHFRDHENAACPKVPVTIEWCAASPEVASCGGNHETPMHSHQKSSIENEHPLFDASAHRVLDNVLSTKHLSNAAYSQQAVLGKKKSGAAVREPGSGVVDGRGEQRGTVSGAAAVSKSRVQRACTKTSKPSNKETEDGSDFLDDSDEDEDVHKKHRSKKRAQQGSSPRSLQLLNHTDLPTTGYW